MKTSQEDSVQIGSLKIKSPFLRILPDYTTMGNSEMKMSDRVRCSFFTISQFTTFKKSDLSDQRFQAKSSKRQTAMSLKTNHSDENLPDATLTDVAMNQVMENKLLLNLILERVENPRDFLKTLRLICSRWKLMAAEILKQRNWTARNFLDFGDDAEIQNYLDDFSDQKESVMFTCFRLFSSTCSSFRVSAYWIDKLFQTFPHSVQSLDLSLCFDSPIQLESILRSQADSLIELSVFSKGDHAVLGIPMRFSPVDFYLSSLKYFCTGSSICSDESDLANLHQLNVLETIFSRIPSQNRNAFKICISDCNQVEETIDLLLEYELVKNLKLLHILAVNKGEFKILAKAGVVLEVLILELEYGKRTYVDATENNKFERDALIQGVYEYLYYQRKTLKLLSWGSSSFKFPLWGIPGLTKLKLKYKNPEDIAPQHIEEEEFDSESEDGNEDPAVPPPISDPILYSEMFPNLKELYLISDRDYRDQYYHHQLRLDFQSMFLVPQLPFTTLQKLEIQYDYLNAQVLRTISKTFPRIKSLGFRHYRRLRRQQQWDFYTALWSAEFASTIEELAIYFEASRSWTRFELHSLFVGVREQEIEQDFTTGPGVSSIYNYKNLKRVKLHAVATDCPAGKGDLAETSALHIFGQIEKLEYLHFDEKICQFSAIHKLKKLLKNGSIKPVLPPSVKNPVEEITGKYFDCMIDPEYDDTPSNLLE